MASSPTLCTSTGWWTEAMPEAVEAVSYGGIEVRSVAPHAHLRASAREPAPCTWRHGPCGRAGQAGRHGFDVRRHQEQPNGKRSSALAARGHANRLEVDAVHLRGARTKQSAFNRPQGWMGSSAHAWDKVCKQGSSIQRLRGLALGVSRGLHADLAGHSLVRWRSPAYRWKALDELFRMGRVRHGRTERRRRATPEELASGVLCSMVALRTR